MSDVVVSGLVASLEGPADAPVIVLANQLGTTRAIWAAQVPVLSRHFRLLRFELPGHGTYGVRSYAPPGPYTLGSLGAGVLGLLDHFDIDAAGFAGASIGGMIGLWLAANKPERISSLAVCCTALEAMPSPASWRERAALVRESGMDTLVDSAPARWFTSSFMASSPAAVQAVVAMLRDTWPEGYAGCGEAIASMDLLGLLGSIRTPTLALAGEADPAAPPWHAARTARAIPGATLRVIPGTSHLAQYQTPGPVTDALLAHFQAR